jgi:hypothetical protein
MKILKKIIPLTAFFFAACAIHPQHGFYEGHGAIGWTHSIDAGSGGVSEYTPASRIKFRLRVTFSTTQRGEIYMNVNSYPDAPDFGGKNIVVSFEDGRTQLIEATQSVSIKVGASDALRVTVPMFRVSGVDIPPLETEFKWNESTKYYVRSIQ